MTPGVSAGAPGPLPYPNKAGVSDCKGSTCAEKTTYDGAKVVLKGSEPSTSMGDEPGNSPGGVVSGGNKGKGSFKLASNSVTVEGKGCVYVGCMIGQNGAPASNMPAGAQVAPTSSKVKVMA